MNATPAPGFAAFREQYEQGHGQVLWRRGVADLETPVAAFLKLADGKPNSFLLESVEGGASRGRYSIIGLEPDLIWRCRAGAAELNRDAHAAPFAFQPDARPPLESLRALIAESRMKLPEGLPPMCGGLIGYLGYDMVRQMERLPNKNTDAIGIPEAILGRPQLFAIFDNVTDLLTLAAPVYPREGLAAAKAWEAAQTRLAEAEAALSRPIPLAAPPVALPPQAEPVSNFTREEFVAVVGRVKDYIRAGDAFRWCRASASRRRSRCRRSRCIGRCGGSTRRRSWCSWISAGSRWCAPAPKYWCGCATTR
jgi:anthranilate synthase component 1